MARRQSQKIRAAREEIREKIASMEGKLGAATPLEQIRISLAIRDLDRIERELAGVYWSRTCPK